MSESSRLNFAEKLLLLSFAEEKGRISYRSAGMIQYIFAAVSIFELCVRKKLRIEGRKVILLDMSPTGDEILDEILSKISEKYDPKSATYWTSALSRGLQKKMMNRLVERGIFWEDYAPLMIVFSRKCYKLSDDKDFKQLHERVREVLLSDNERFTVENIVIAAMMKSSGILPLHFDKGEIARLKGRMTAFLKDQSLIEQIMGSELAEAYKAVNRALTEVKAAAAGA